MQSILLIGAVQAIFLSLLIITKSKKTIADYLLFSLLVFTSLPLFLYYFLYDFLELVLSNSKNMPNFMYYINIPIIMTYTPIFYLYIKANIQSSEKFNPKNLFHFSPVLFFIILVLFFANFKDISNTDFNFYKTKHFWLFLFFAPLTLVLAIFYIIKSFKLLIFLSKKVKENYSFTEEIDLKWLKILLIVVTTMWIVLIPTAIIFAKNENIFEMYKVLLFLLTLVVFVIAFFGFKQSDVFKNYTLFESSKPESNLLNFEIKKITETIENKEDVLKLIEFMKKEKPYLENKLTIAQLADKLNWQPYYLSKILNENMNQNFYEFVNHYRVEEFKIRLNQNKNYTILAIAIDCGFNSKSSFNRIFKELCGQTPSDYKNISTKVQCLSN